MTGVGGGEMTWGGGGGGGNTRGEMTGGMYRGGGGGMTGGMPSYETITCHIFIILENIFYFSIIGPISVLLKMGSAITTIIIK